MNNSCIPYRRHLPAAYCLNLPIIRTVRAGERRLTVRVWGAAWVCLERLKEGRIVVFYKNWIGVGTCIITLIII